MMKKRTTGSHMTSLKTLALKVFINALSVLYYVNLLHDTRVGSG